MATQTPETAMKNAGEWLRFITPILVTINLWTLSQMSRQLEEINSRLYLHQTNEEIHIPRAEVVRIENQIEHMQAEVIKSIRESVWRR